MGREGGRSEGDAPAAASASAAAAALPPEEARLTPAAPALARAGGRLLEELDDEVLPVELGEREGGVAVVL